MRLAWPNCLRALVIALAAVTTTAVMAPLAAQSSPPADAAAPLAQGRTTLDRIETALKRERLSTADLIELGREAAPVRDDLRGRIANLEPQLAEVQTRLKQLGPAPAAGAPPEVTTLATERGRLIQEVAAVDARLKEARLLGLRADQLIDRITARRFSAYARDLFTQNWSIIDRAFWRQATEAVVNDLRRIGALLVEWGRFVAAAGMYRILGAVLTLLGLGIAASVVMMMWRRRSPVTHTDRVGAKVWQSTWACVRAAVAMPLIVISVLWLLQTYGLVPSSLDALVTALEIAVVIAAIGRGAAVGTLAATEPERRLMPYSDRTARALSGHLIAGVRITAIFTFLGLLHKETAAPQVLVIFTSILFAVAILAVMLHLLYQQRTSGAVFDDGQVHGDLWIRGIAWLMTVGIAGATLGGYARLAEFLAQRLIVAVVIFALVYLLLQASNTLFTETLSVESPRGRAIVANLGLHPRRAALLGEVANGAARVVLVVLALMFVFGPWEGTTTDIMAPLQSLSFGITIGETTISLPAIFGAMGVLLVGIVITRIIQGWLDRRLLPHTDLPPSLQQSVAAIFGYVGIIAAISLALGALGIDPQKIALVAGALSVGIGFGLQSIVSNFVSGLILLTERPIRVGDWIIAKGEEGFVRRIRVRATEVETFDSASVIIPNSELISGVVKNWTYNNTMGRLTLKIGVGYDSDPVKVRDILLAAADAHPGILKIPPPSALFTEFGDNALQFELGCVVRDVKQRGVIRSDLNFTVLTRFREAGIIIPYPQRTVHLAGGPTRAHED